MSQFASVTNATMPITNSDEDYYANESFETDTEFTEETDEHVHEEQNVNMQEKKLYAASKRRAFSYLRRATKATTRTTTTTSDVLAYGSSSEDDNDVIISQTVAEINTTGIIEVLESNNNDKDALHMTPSARLFNRAVAARHHLGHLSDEKTSSEFEAENCYEAKAYDFSQMQVDEDIEGNNEDVNADANDDDDGDETVVEDNDEDAAVYLDDEDDDYDDLTAVEDNWDDELEENEPTVNKANVNVKPDDDDYDEDAYEIEYGYEEVEEDEEINEEIGNEIENENQANKLFGGRCEEFIDKAAAGDAENVPKSNLDDAQSCGGIKNGIKKGIKQVVSKKSGMHLKHVRTEPNLPRSKGSNIAMKRSQCLSQKEGAGDQEELVELYKNEKPVAMARSQIPVKTTKTILRAQTVNGADGDKAEHEKYQDYNNVLQSASSSGGSSTRSDMSIEYSIRSRTPSSYTASRHRMHVDFVKSTTTPTPTPTLPAGKRRNLSFTNTRTREIERHNEILLNKILTQKSAYDANNPIKKKSTKFANLPPTTRVSSAEVNRRKQQRQIDLDNQLLKRKLENIAARKMKKK